MFRSGKALLSRGGLPRGFVAGEENKEPATRVFGGPLTLQPEATRKKKKKDSTVQSQGFLRKEDSNRLHHPPAREGAG